jgi:hypothetical protein
MNWFGHLEKVLEGFSAGFRSGALRTALHTDLMSPVATTPTWSKLNPLDKSSLEAHGVPLWHELIEHLQPHLIIVSVAREHFEKIHFSKYPAPPHRIVLGTKIRYPVTAHTVQLASGRRTDVIYSTPAQVPFGFLAHSEKVQVGTRLRGHLSNW